MRIANQAMHPRPVAGLVGALGSAAAVIAAVGKTTMKKEMIMAGLVGSLLGLFGCGKGQKLDYKVAAVYNGLRQQLLATDPKTIGLSPSTSNRVWAVLMETGYPEAVVTLATVGDGTVSLYFSHGGGIIGVGQHEDARKAGLELISTAQSAIGSARQTDKFPLPENGHTQFYFLTFEGAYTADAREKDLENNHHQLSQLFYKAQDVITQARLIEEKRQQTTGKMLHAATTGDTKALRSLLDSGIAPDIADPTGLTPLMAASYSGMTEALVVLLDSGAKIEATDASGYTALMFACNAGKTDCARLLIERNADITRGDKDASTPIMFAAQHGHNEIIRLLLAKGADPQFKGTHGLSAIGFAHQNGHTESERILTKQE